VQVRHKRRENVPWGHGDTLLKEVLVTMQKRNYRFQAGIELEYKIPERVSSMTEIRKCLDCCRNALA
jgi:hypothetical protein